MGARPTLTPQPEPERERVPEREPDRAAGRVVDRADDRADDRGVDLAAEPVTRPGLALAGGTATAAWHEGEGAGVVHAIDPLCVVCDRPAQRPPGVDRPEVTSPEAAADLVVPALAHADRERCLLVLLDTKHRLLELATVSIGSLDHTFMSPREVFRDALLANAAALVLAHNHPSGDPEPSRDDERLTRRLVRAGEIVGVEVLDHLVIGGRRWISLARRGLV